MSQSVTSAPTGDLAQEQPTPEQRARTLERLLSDAGVRARVEARASLAIVVLGEGSASLAAAARRACVRAATDAGFTHVALEIEPAP